MPDPRFALAALVLAPIQSTPVQPQPAHDLTRGAALNMNSMAAHFGAGALDRIAPQDADSALLRATLTNLPPNAPASERAALIATLERRRWLAREERGLRLVVNIPAFRLDLLDGDRMLQSHRVIVGKPATPTPQFAAAVQAVTINPTWIVPGSIIAESVGRLIRTHPRTARARGYTWSRTPSGGLSVVQKPGAQNALGRIKFEFPNPYRVYIHDTPSRELFDQPGRAFSHGCIRLAEPEALAATLLAGQGWDRERIADAIAAGKTVRVALASAVPVDIVYFTAERGEGRSVRYWPDLYGLDMPLARRVAGSGPLAVRAAAPATECSAPPVVTG